MRPDDPGGRCAEVQGCLGDRTVGYGQLHLSYRILQDIYAALEVMRACMPRSRLRPYFIVAIASSVAMSIPIKISRAIFISSPLPIGWPARPGAQDRRR